MNEVLDSDYHFRKTDHFPVKRVSCLYNIKYLSLFVFFLHGELCDSLVKVGVKRLVICLDYSKPLTFKIAHQLAVDQLRTLFCCVAVVRFEKHLQGSFTVIQNREKSLDGFSGSHTYELQLFL